MYWFRAIKLFECQKKNTFGIRNTQYSIALSVHKTTNCIQYNIHDTKSCELPTYVFKSCMVSCYQIVWMKKMCMGFHMFFKTSVGFVLLNCLNAKKKKKYIWNTKYTIQHSIERSQTSNCIQYNIHNTMSYEFPNYIVNAGCFVINKKSINIILYPKVKFKTKIFTENTNTCAAIYLRPVCLPLEYFTVL